MLWSFAVPALAEEPAATASVGAFVESYYGFNTNQPANGVTALRGFDARHNSLALSLAAVHVAVEEPVLRARVALQAGPTARSYYAAEPASAEGFGVAATGADGLHHVREAWAGGRADGGLTVDAGVFLSPVGYDAIASHENHFWSLANLGVGLPFYFTGLRAEQPLAGGWAVRAGVFNGWNSVVDNNAGKSVMAAVGKVLPSGAEAQALYLGGVEGPEGARWRNLFDLWFDVPLGPWLLIGGLNGGFEPRAEGVHHWQAAQLALVRGPTAPWTFGVRGDLFQEDGPDGVAGNVFWPTRRVGEATVTFGWRPADGLIVRLEGRHDRAADAVFYRGDDLDPSAVAQTTVTLGVAGWFEREIR